MSTKVKMFWATRGETIEKKFGDVSISRDVKLGMTVESDSGDRSEDMHIAIIKALNVAMEKEREGWMNDKVMKLEIDRLSKIEPELDEEGNPVVKTLDEKKSIRRNQNVTGQSSSTDDGEF